MRGLRSVKNQSPTPSLGRAGSTNHQNEILDRAVIQARRSSDLSLRAVATSETSSGDDKSLVYATWESRVYQYEWAAAIEAQFTVGSVSFNSEYRLLVMDTVRSATEVVGDHRRVWGYGYRFLVEVSDISLVGKLTLPAIAGAAETTSLEATVRLDVKGYDGNEMWDVIPPPKPLDVDTYSTYLGAVVNIQKTFADHPEKAFPVLLAEGRIDGVDILDAGIDEPDVSSAVAVVATLRMCEQGRSLADAAGYLVTTSINLPVESIDAITRGVYTLLSAEDPPDSRPHESARARARQLLDASL